MARALATLPEGSRITDYVSLGVITRRFPLERVRAVLASSGKASLRQRDLPAHVVVYAITLALYMQSSYREVLRCQLEGLQWLREPALTLKVAGHPGTSQAHTRLGWEPLRQLHDEVVKPIAVAATQGAWYRRWRVVSLDGSTMDVADEQANDEVFGRPGASHSAVGGMVRSPLLEFVVDDAFQRPQRHRGDQQADGQRVDHGVLMIRVTPDPRRNHQPDAQQGIAPVIKLGG